SSCGKAAPVWAPTGSGPGPSAAAGWHGRQRGTRRTGENGGVRIAVLGTGGVGRPLAGPRGGLGPGRGDGTRGPPGPRARTEPGGFGTPPYPLWQAEHPGVRLLSFADAAAFAELLFNATSGGSAMAALVAAGEPALAGKVLIDVSNPLDYSRGMPPTLDPV